MKLTKKPLNEETRYTALIIVTILSILIVFFLFDRFFNKSSDSIVQSKQEKTIIVKEADIKEVQSKIPPKSVVDSVRKAIGQGNYSTAYMQLSKAAKGSPEYEELNKLIAAEKQKKQTPGIRKEAETPQNPLRYLDESTPRNRETDWVYAYFSDIAGALWPRFCIQAVDATSLNITGFRIKADKKTFDVRAPVIKSEEVHGKVAQWYDAAVDSQLYYAIQALMKARKASIEYIGAKQTRERDITEEEKKGLRRIMEAYIALGGSFAFVNPEVGNKAINKH